MFFRLWFYGFLLLWFSGLYGQQLSQDAFLRFVQGPSVGSQFLGESWLLSRVPSSFLELPFRRLFSKDGLGPRLDFQANVWSWNPLRELPRFQMQVQASHFGELSLDLQTHIEEKPLRGDFMLQVSNHARSIGQNQWLEIPLHRQVFFRNHWQVQSPNYTSNTLLDWVSVGERQGHRAFWYGDSLAFGLRTELSRFSLNSEHFMTLRKGNMSSDLLFARFWLRNFDGRQTMPRRELRSQDWSLGLGLTYSEELQEGRRRFYLAGHYHFYRFDERLSDVSLAQRAYHEGELRPGYFLLLNGAWRLDLALRLHYLNALGLRVWPDWQLAWLKGPWSLRWQLRAAGTWLYFLTERPQAWQGLRQAYWNADPAKVGETYALTWQGGRSWNGLSPHQPSFYLGWQGRSHYDLGFWLEDWTWASDTLYFDWQERGRAWRHEFDALFRLDWLDRGQGHWTALAVYRWHFFERFWRGGRGQQVFLPRNILGLALAWQKGPWQTRLQYWFWSPQVMPLGGLSPVLQRLDVQLVYQKEAYQWRLGLDNVFNHRQLSDGPWSQIPNPNFDGALRWHDFMRRRLSLSFLWTL